jgi:hypothetical protein
LPDFIHSLFTACELRMNEACYVIHRLHVACELLMKG